MALNIDGPRPPSNGRAMNILLAGADNGDAGGPTIAESAIRSSGSLTRVAKAGTARARISRLDAPRPGVSVWAGITGTL